MRRDLLARCRGGQARAVFFRVLMLCLRQSGMLVEDASVASPAASARQAGRCEGVFARTCVAAKMSHWTYGGVAHPIALQGVQIGHAKGIRICRKRPKRHALGPQRPAGSQATLRTDR